MYTLTYTDYAGNQHRERYDTWSLARDKRDTLRYLLGVKASIQ